jgi:hypothetical protein
MNCKYCGSTHLQKRGRERQSFGKISTKYQCMTCKKYQRTESRHARSAKILMLDIETMLMEFYGFSPYNEYVSYKFMKKDWSISCWAAKWLFEPEIMGAVVTPEEAIDRRDDSVLAAAWKLLDEADIVVWHNGNQFDQKKLNTRFLLAGYSPPSHYLSVDTKKVSKEVFGNSYNHLEELGRKFGIGVKDKMEAEDWIRCAEGNKEYLDKMLKYCKRDVAPLLEDVYLRLLPWITSHPNLNLFTIHDDSVCPKCESTDLQWNTTYKTPEGLWQGFRCGACGAIGRGKGKENKIKVAQVK